MSIDLETTKPSESSLNYVVVYWLRCDDGVVGG